MATDYQFAVIGAGVVGLAVAAELAPRGSLLVLEKDWKFGQSTSSHNSEVVHAGIYYTPSSLKATLCVAGNRMIRNLVQAHGFGYSQTGKFIVAVNDKETEYLEWLKGNAEASGVHDLRWISMDELREHEPSVRGAACLFSPTSGIVDSHGLMAHFKTQAELAGADFAFNTRVAAIRRISGGYALNVCDSGGEETEITASCVVNSAGLYADEIASMAGLDVRALGLELHWAKGYYYTLEGGPRFGIRHLVYPVPDKNMKSLGVHATVDLSGGLRFGPTAFYLDHRSEDYSFGDENLEPVAAAISRYLPGVKAESLNAMMSGIRPKLSAQGQPARDFYIREERDHGLPGFVNLIGIESPGLTASPAIARMVGELLHDYSA